MPASSPCGFPEPRARRAIGLLIVAGTVAIAPCTAAARPAEVFPDSARALDRRLAEEQGIHLIPVEARGDIRFILDSVWFLNEHGSNTIEILVRLPHTGLRFARLGASYIADVVISARVEDAEGERSRSVEARRRIEVGSFEETRRVAAYTLEVLSAEIQHDPARLEVKVEDARAQKRTLIGLLSGARRSGECRALLPRRAIPKQGPALSSLLFGSRLQPAESSASTDGVSVHGGLTLVPNPSRFYGLEQTVFPVYFEVYRRDARDGFLQEEASHRVRYTVKSAEGNEVITAEDTLVVGSGRWGNVQRFDVSNFPSGTYVLNVELLAAGGEPLDATYGDFHVLWSPSSVFRDEKSILAEARVLLTVSDYEGFKDLEPGEREAYISRVWEDVDPTPGTAVNEARAEFEARVRRAERDYGGIDGGMLSDRGQVLIRFGDPDEIVPMRIPTYESVIEAAARRELLEGFGGLIDLDDPVLASFLSRQFRDNPAFEIWKFFGGGHPIVPPVSRPPSAMVFIFVDEQGVGIYRLGYTNVIGIL